MRNLRWPLLVGLSAAVAFSCSDDDGDGAGGDAVPGPGGSSVGGAGRGGTGGGGAFAGGTMGGNAGTASGGTSGNAGSTSGGTGAAGGDPNPTNGGASSGAGGDSNTGGAEVSEAGAGGLREAGEGGAAGTGGGPSGSTCSFPENAALAKASVPDGFCAWAWATGVSAARGITTDEAGNVLAIAKGDSAVVALWDDDGDGISGPGERATLVTQSGLNHGIALHGGYLYASSATTVYRWAYEADRAPLTNGEAVVTGMPATGHWSRTLVFDGEYLYVSVGSELNVDQNSDRARIRRFPIADLGEEAIAFGTGDVFADGLRNEVGLRFDAQGRLWGVENGRDKLSREDLGGDIHNDNPAEELNLFAEPGKFYGYPYCWTEYLLPDDVGEGRGTQWADPDPNDARTDEWCRDTANVVPPVLSMQAHAAPLDLLFYSGGAFPSSYTGDLFVTFHGSWNREEPTGYKVVHIPFGTDGMPSGEPVPFLEYSGTGDEGAGWLHRPVGLTTLPNGALLVTSDGSNSILAVGYAP